MKTYVILHFFLLSTKPIPKCPSVRSFAPDVNGNVQRNRLLRIFAWQFGCTTRFPPDTSSSKVRTRGWINPLPWCKFEQPLRRCNQRVFFSLESETHRQTLEGNPLHRLGNYSQYRLIWTRRSVRWLVSSLNYDEFEQRKLPRRWCLHMVSLRRTRRDWQILARRPGLWLHAWFRPVMGWQSSGSCHNKVSLSQPCKILQPLLCIGVFINWN